MSVRSAHNSSIFELQILSWLKAIEDPYAYTDLKCFDSKKNVDIAYDKLDACLLKCRKENASEIKNKFIDSLRTIHALLREEAHQLRDLSSDEEKQHILLQTKHHNHIQELRHLKKIYSLQFPDRYTLIEQPHESTNIPDSFYESHPTRLLSYISNFINNPYHSFSIPEFASSHDIDEKFQQFAASLRRTAANNPNDLILQKAVQCVHWYSEVLKELSHTITRDTSAFFPDIYSLLTKTSDKKLKKKAVQVIMESIHSLPGYKNLSKLKDRL